MKNKIKYFLPLIALLILIICFGNMAMAENEVIENKAIKKIEVINAEDIGIKTIEKTFVETPVSTEVTADKNKTVDYKEEAKSTNEKKAKSVKEEEAKSVNEEEFIEDEPAYEPFEVPEGLYEGYEEGVYFEPNCFDCELHECCYKCEEHEIEIEYFWDEEINPNEGWVRSEICIICGHGTCKPVTEEEIE